MVVLRTVGPLVLVGRRSAVCPGSDATTTHAHRTAQKCAAGLCDRFFRARFVVAHHGSMWATNSTPGFCAGAITSRSSVECHLLRVHPRHQDGFR